MSRLIDHEVPLRSPVPASCGHDRCTYLGHGHPSVRRRRAPARDGLRSDRPGAEHVSAAAAAGVGPSRRRDGSRYGYGQPGYGYPQQQPQAVRTTALISPAIRRVITGYPDGTQPSTEDQAAKRPRMAREPEPSADPNDAGYDMGPVTTPRSTRRSTATATWVEDPTITAGCGVPTPRQWAWISHPMRPAVHGSGLTRAGTFNCDWDWGWLPFHYGRWGWYDGYWGWQPGYAWGPALGRVARRRWLRRLASARADHPRSPRHSHNGPTFHDHRTGDPRDSQWRFTRRHDFGKGHIRGHLSKMHRKVCARRRRSSGRRSRRTTRRSAPRASCVRGSDRTITGRSRTVPPTDRSDGPARARPASWRIAWSVLRTPAMSQPRSAPRRRSVVTRRRGVAPRRRIAPRNRRIARRRRPIARRIGRPRRAVAGRTRVVARISGLATRRRTASSWSHRARRRARAAVVVAGRIRVRRRIRAAAAAAASRTRAVGVAAAATRAVAAAGIASEIAVRRN